MKSVLLFVTVISISLSSVGQERSPETNSQFSANLLMPSLEYEIKIGGSSTVDLQLGAGFGYHKSGSESDFGVFAAFQSSYRYYYNLKKRVRRHKKVSENSGNYIAAIATVQSGKPILGDYNFNNNYSILIGPAWGLQRTYFGGFKLNMNIGAGYGFNDLGNSYFSPFVAIQLGWLIAK